MVRGGEIVSTGSNKTNESRNVSGCFAAASCFRMCLLSSALTQTVWPNCCRAPATRSLSPSIACCSGTAATSLPRASQGEAPAGRQRHSTCSRPALPRPATPLHAPFASEQQPTELLFLACHPPLLPQGGPVCDLRAVHHVRRRAEPAGLPLRHLWLPQRQVWRERVHPACPRHRLRRLRGPQLQPRRSRSAAAGSSARDGCGRGDSGSRGRGAARRGRGGNWRSGRSRQ